MNVIKVRLAYGQRLQHILDDIEKGKGKFIPVQVRLDQVSVLFPFKEYQCIYVPGLDLSVIHPEDVGQFLTAWEGAQEIYKEVSEPGFFAKLLRNHGRKS